MAAPHMKTANLQQSTSHIGLLTYYGVMLFAFMGIFVVPEMKRELKKHFKDLKKAIITAILICTIIYVLFASTTLVTGQETTQVATVGLSQALGKPVQIVANLFAALAMMTALIAVGFVGKELFMYDYKIKRVIAWAIMVSIPLLISLIKGSTFINIIALTGTISGTATLILVMLIFHRAKEKGNRLPEYKIPVPKIITYTLIALLIIAAITNLVI
jgi:amino acid transporter